MAYKINNLQEYQTEYAASVENPEAFWAKQADRFQWKKKWDSVLDWNFSEPDVKWFSGGQLNISENCLDRHLKDKGDKVAFFWEPNEPSETGRAITYKQLHTEVCRFSNVLKSLGAKKGERICIYMPMIPEVVVAVLACARIGAIHSVVFAGFSASSLTDRINDAKADLVITSDGSFRGNKTIAIKDIVDDALENSPGVKNVIVYKRTGQPVKMKSSRDLWWNELVEKASAEHKAEAVESEDPLFILYTSGSTGKPKGVVHTTAGYMVYSEYSFSNVFQCEKNSIYWSTADIGWITGHTYIVYGPLLAGVTSVLFEGIPTHPTPSRFWEVVDKYKVTHFYTAPTAIRSLMACGLEHVTPYKLESLKVLGSVGEPINEEAWHWYDDYVGKNNCPIVDTWWQTETGGILISPLAGITKTKPSYATLPLPGIQPVIVDSEGQELEGNDVEGNLCIKFPWPSILRTTYGDHERCRQTYFSTYKNLYFTGDGCRRDEDGYYRILGRVDDVINVSGHRMGTAEVENAINEDEAVIESAVVGYPHDIKGQGIYAFVICEDFDQDHDKIRQSILATVTRIIGPIAKPDKVQIVRGLPKTRSGKIMRRILRKIAEGDVFNLGDISTLLDPGVVEEIKKGALVTLKG
ncbi:acetyl-CoA synthetase [Sporocytophaga myxococcoides]|uniref:Acetate--CoA ligase n=1 Tax=Sporocytophaga myxococcoides TaxID=153721 RepID=A0A098LDZ6_9BACT|nr:acetate--CoA ligase [Sporocytophaga myxococcoides]GAL85221.1 acetyl-CoA synthetase [Sporocytophaga myxococcoides]